MQSYTVAIMIVDDSPAPAAATVVAFSIDKPLSDLSRHQAARL